jgi:glycopeptide antibiotics resistance protein
MNLFLVSFLVKHNRNIRISYILIVILIAVLPLNSQQNFVINNTYVVKIRLDHLLHGILFMPWLWLSRSLRGYSFFFSLLSGLLLAITAEGLQILLPYRAFNINDMISNMIGICAGIPLYFIPVSGSEKKDEEKIRLFKE